MSFILGNITLPNPKSFTREFIETSAANLLIEGKTTKIWDCSDCLIFHKKKVVDFINKEKFKSHNNVSLN